MNIYTVRPFFGVVLFLITISTINAAPVALDWHGTIQSVTLDAGGAVYSGTPVGQAFSGGFIYDVSNVIEVFTSDGDSLIEPTDVWVEHSLGPGNPWFVTNGSTQVDGDHAGSSITNDFPCNYDAPDGCDEASDIFGQVVPDGTLFDVWGIEGNGHVEIEIAYASMDSSMFPAGDFEVRSMPPFMLPSGDANKVAIFRLAERLPGGAVIFRAWGMLDSVQIVPDSDGDGLFDNEDNCIDQANADQRDTNNDDIGNACDADLNGDCLVNFGDLALLKAGLFPVNDPDADFDGDGLVNFGDLAFMKSTFFNSANPGPGPGAPGNACE